RFTRGIGDVGVARNGELCGVAHTGAEQSARRAVIDVEAAVRGVVRIEGQAEQTFFAAKIDLARDIEIRRRVHGARWEIDDFDLSRLLHNKEPAGVARRRGDEDGRGKSPGETLRIELWRGLHLELCEQVGREEDGGKGG